MNPVKAIYCRSVQAVLRAALPVLPYREPQVFHSCGELSTVFQKENIRRVLIVTDAGIVRSGIAAQLETVLDEDDISYAVYDQTRPNPTVVNVEQALSLYRRYRCQALIAIGGGSSMDVLIPKYAVLDARLTLSLPPHLTATTGMDALTHAVEAYIGRSTTRQTRQEALEATRLVFANVERAYRNGKDYEARSNMLTAAYRAGIAFSRSYVGYVHAVAHSLGGQYNIPHGLANAVLLPYVLESYGSCIHRKLHDLAVAAGVASPQEEDAGAAAKFIRAIRQLNARMGIPETLEGIRPEDIPVMAAHAEKEANPLYPVPRLMTREELTFFYEQVAGKECHGQQAS